MHRRPFAQSINDEQPCRSECHKLLALVDAITAARPAFAPAFADWHQQANGLLDSPDLETLAGEVLLEEMALALRRIWLGLAHSFADRPMKSPPHLEDVALPFSKDLTNYVYERVLTPSRLEERCQKRYPPVAGWESRFCLFSSAMGALTNLLQVLPRFLSAKGETPRWDSFIGYYETERLLRLHDKRGVYCRRYRKHDGLLERVASGKTDILLVEPSMYDWDQTVLDPGLLVQAILERPSDRPLALILDTSLLGPAFRMEDLLKALARSCPLLAIELRSGLKLDQEGLELSNVGIARLFTREGAANGIFATERWLRHMNSARKIFGHALSLDEMAILDLPWFSDPQRLDNYASQVFSNNVRLAAALSKTNGLFARIAHPSLTERAEWQWAQSPFVIAHFHDNEDRQDNRNLLESVIYNEAKRRGLTVHLGSSFGFRHHRFEIVLPEGYERPDGSSRGFLKVAMGHRQGPSCDGFIQLLCEIATHDDFQALRQSYPDLGPLKPTKHSV
ncbi:MAG: hypothetical protein HQL44_01375 [Alphaproteobacteria bacterium]|nr:hypothetical protein [Alphaproteobacteria bacterium]